MADIKLPVRDMQFVLFDLFDFEAHCRAIPEFAETSADVVNAILEELAKFCENVLAPLNAVGDREGCQLNGHEVKTPSGFREAYQQFVAAGWPSMCNDTAFGGQGLPESLGSLMNESVGTANWAWGMYPGLSHGAMRTIAQHGTEEQRQTYLSKLVEGVWTGTMCLTEAHCGTDLGMLKTKAEPQADGSHTITGTKIFISAGEHDLSENIVHIVLARLPDAPEGTKGISLFIVPKFLPDGTRNKVFCGSLEHKMGIHGNATCVLNFDGAKGFLIGQPNRGLNAMFTFMNRARLGTAVQGLCHAEFGYQKALAYAKDRLQMRALSGPKNPDGPADPIIVHPDVRRMLLTQKAFTEGSRMLAYFTAMQLDIEDHATDEEAKKEAADLLAFLTPIAKAFMTEFGFECANHAMQCFGGHGYIREWGVEQNVRDARIAMLYEGTTGIQALDLLGRKVLMTQGETLRRFTKLIHKFCKTNAENADLKPLIDSLAQHNKEWGDLTMHIGLKAMENPEEVGAAAVDYLMYSGYVSLAYFWARAAVTAQEKLAEGTAEKSFFEAKIKTAEFYFARILPRTRTHFAAIHSGVGNLLALDANQF
jgi:Acyl-CoA dehydrogenases